MRVFDGHSDTISHCMETGQRLADCEAHLNLAKLSVYDSYAQFFALWEDWELHPGQSLYPIFLEKKALFDREMEENADKICLCTTADGCEKAWSEGRIAAFLSVEGAEMLDCDIDRLHIAHQMGVRAVNPTWNHPNALSGTNMTQADRGLTDKGFAFLREMNELGMLVDVSHISDPGFWDIAEHTSAPIFASHSNSRSCCFHTRNLTDDQFTAIIQLKGAVGMNLCHEFLGSLPTTVDTVVRHLEHFLDLGGEDVVALGGDWDGISHPPLRMEDVTGWTVLYRRLEELGYPQELLDKLFYKNLMRVVRKVCVI